MMRILFLLFFTVSFFNPTARASHIFGADLSYKNIAGLTYQVNLTLYGDCGGASFLNLYTAIPELLIYNGTQTYAVFNMQPVGNSGIEVTPVCASQILNTSCNGGAIPGVAQFEFRATVTLPYTSTDWKFVFNGEMGGNSGAGRSNNISNVVPPGQGAYIMRMEATLNNASNGQNNSAYYTTIPTPFFCINSLHQYNQGAVDADGDVLSYSLVPAMLANSGTVVYQTPYTFSNPISVANNNFNFNSNSGQISFLPNLVGNYVIVTRLNETRNGVVVGSSMREMVFVIQGNCNNQPPGGAIINSNSGLIINSGTELQLCDDGITSTVFDINVFDPDTQNVNVALNGLPSNAVANILNNNTPNPTIQITILKPNPFQTGDFTFFVTFTDDGCPLSSKQTSAYTVRFMNPYTSLNTTISPESCNPGGDAAISVVTTNANGGIQYSMNGGSASSTSTFSNLSAGSYTIQLQDARGCRAQTVAIIPPSNPPVVDSVTIKPISCNGFTDGGFQIHVTSAFSCQYQLTSLGLTNSTGYFGSLAPGIYNVTIVDANGCTNTASATLTEPPPIQFTGVTASNTFCDRNNGKIIATSNLSNGIVFLLKPGIGSNSDGIFENLPPNTYTLIVRNEFNCSTETTVTVGSTPNDFQASILHKDLPCQGSGFEGEAEIIASGGVPPYSYLWTSREIGPSTDQKITNLPYGWYSVTTTDVVGCNTLDTVYINPGNCCENIFAPNAFTPNGDGNNDIWQLVTSSGIAVQHFAVYNRWGQKVWEGDDQRSKWDGKQDGRVVDIGSYYYILRYTCLTDEKKYTKKGEITILK
jgi:gliding motility-associated-like protein